MTRSFRTVVLGAILLLLTFYVVSQVGAGPSATADPGREQASQVLDCASGDEIFSYTVTWTEGAGKDFSTPSQALDALLASATFLDLDASSFSGKDVQLADLGVDSASNDIGREFTGSDAQGSDYVTWTVPADGGWLAYGLYGCYTPPEGEG